VAGIDGHRRASTGVGRRRSEQRQSALVQFAALAHTPPHTGAAKASFRRAQSSCAHDRHAGAGCAAPPRRTPRPRQATSESVTLAAGSAVVVVRNRPAHLTGARRAATSSRATVAASHFFRVCHTRRGQRGGCRAQSSCAPDRHAPCGDLVARHGHGKPLPSLSHSPRAARGLSCAPCALGTHRHRKRKMRFFFLVTWRPI
jgi:hypothetical protein